MTTETLVTGQPGPAGSAPQDNAPAPAATDWRSTLPDDLKQHPSLGKFKDLPSFAKSYVQLEQYQGRSVALPGPEATPEEREAFWRKVGKPESPDKYKLVKPKGVEFDPNLERGFRETAHRLNLTQDQVAGLLEYYTGTLGNHEEMVEKLGQETSRQLKSEWGGAYDYNLALSQRAVRQVGGSEMVELLRMTGLGNHPVMVKFFHKLGKDYAEDGEILRDPTGSTVLGPAEAKAKIDAIMHDKTHAYHRGDKAAVDEVFKLWQIVTEAQ